MKCNVGKLDRFIRGITGVSLGFHAMMHLNIVSLIVSAVLLFTATTRWCIPYQFLGINTGCNLHNPYKSVRESLVEGIAVSVVLYILVLLVYLVYRYIKLLLV